MSVQLIIKQVKLKQGGKTNLYCRLPLKSSVLKTKSIKEAGSWNECFVIPVDQFSDLLNFEVWGDDENGKEAQLGAGCVSVMYLYNPAKDEGSFSFSEKENEVGTVLFSYQFFGAGQKIPEFAEEEKKME